MAEQTHAKGYTRAARISRLVFALFVKNDLPATPAPVGKGPVLIAANHRSFYDIFLAYMLCVGWGLTPRMLVRGSFFSTPGLGWMLRKTGCIPVNSGEGSMSIDDALEELNHDRSVAIMPEGRLVKAEDRPTGIGEARDGVGVLALKSGSPIIAVGVAGSERVWPIGKPLPPPRLRRTKVVVRCRVVEELQGSATDAKNTIMAAISDAVAEAEVVRSS